MMRKKENGQGCCRCTDCGGTDSLLPCFWELNRYNFDLTGGDASDREYFSAEAEGDEAGALSGSEGGEPRARSSSTSRVRSKIQQALRGIQKITGSSKDRSGTAGDSGSSPRRLGRAASPSPRDTQDEDGADTARDASGDGSEGPRSRRGSNAAAALAGAASPAADGSGSAALTGPTAAAVAGSEPGTPGTPTAPPGDPVAAAAANKKKKKKMRKKKSSLSLDDARSPRAGPAVGSKTGGLVSDIALTLEEELEALQIANADLELQVEDLKCHVSNLQDKVAKASKQRQEAVSLLRKERQQTSKRLAELEKELERVCEERDLALEETAISNAKATEMAHTVRQLERQIETGSLHSIQSMHSMQSAAAASTSRMQQTIAQMHADLDRFMGKQALFTQNVQMARSHLTASLATATPTMPTEGISPFWPGQGSPYLHHLQRVVALALPHLVTALSSALAPTGIVLVGASAWNAYTDIPLATENLDFVAPSPGADLRAICEAVIRIAASVHEVRYALAVLEGVTPIAAEWRRWLEERGTPEQLQSICERIRLAEVQDDGSSGERKASVSGDAASPSGSPTGAAGGSAASLGSTPFRVSAIEGGWRIQLAHCRVLDVMQANERDQQLLGRFAPMEMPLSAVVPFRHVYAFEGSSDPSVRVASVPMLLAHLEWSLDTGIAWRVMKGLPRLRQLSVNAWVQMQCGGGLMGAFMRNWEMLLAKHDRAWLAVLQYNRQLTFEALAFAGASGPPSHPASPSRLVLTSSDGSGAPASAALTISSNV